MDKYTSANHRLAELLDCDSKAWCHDWNACGPLMVEHGCWPSNSIGWGAPYIIVRDANGNEIDSDDSRNHPDSDTAVRFCIVTALIVKLESQKQQQLSRASGT